MAKELIGLSCVCVGTGQGGTISMLARVSLVDRRGNLLYDAYVLPTSAVESYRSATTGLDQNHFTDAVSFNDAQLTVAAWLQDRIVVGHQLWLDLQVLGLSHPAVDTRDVALFLPFRNALHRPNEIIGLPTLVWHLMRRKIQAEYLDSSENARACVDLYRSYENEWEGKPNQQAAEHSSHTRELGSDGVRSRVWQSALPPTAYGRCYT